MSTDNSPNRSPDFNRRDRFRILMLVFTLILVVIAIKLSSDPANWSWMFPEEAGIDAEILEDQNSISENVFRLERQSDRMGESNVADHPNESVEIDPGLLTLVDDHRIGIHADEAPAYYRLLAKARDLPSAEIEKAGRSDVAYTVLMVDSDRYRGTLISIDGRLRRLMKLSTGPNLQNIEELYEAWIFTDDSGTNPYHVVFTELPDELPQGQRIDPPLRVRTTGFFFKRQGYAAQHGLHFAPLLLAATVHSVEITSVMRPPDETRLAPYVISVAIVITLAVILTLWRYRAGDRAFHQLHKRRMLQPTPEALESLQHVKTEDVEDAIREMTEQVRPVEVEHPDSGQPDGK